MRNLKKVLSLALALVMLLGMMVVGAGAVTTTKDYTDGSGVKYVEAVDVMSAIGVFGGTGNNQFTPQGNLTRAQAAKIITYMLLGKEAAEKLGTLTAPFADVPASNWAAGSIAYCSNMGIVSGIGNNKFNPDGLVTGYQFAKMLLVALGYDAEREGMVGKDWSINVAKLAITAAGLDVGISNGTDIVLENVLTREEACQMAFNTIKANMVEYATNASSITVGNTPIIIGGSNATAVTVALGGNGENIYATTMDNRDVLEFGERYFPALRLISTVDASGRPAHIWTLSGRQFGEYSNNATYTYTAKTGVGGVEADMKGTLFPAAGAELWTNGVDGGKAIASIKDIADQTANGRIVEVFVNNNNVTDVVVTNVALGRVSKVDTAKEELTVQTVASSSANAVSLTTKVGYGSFQKDDMVIIYACNAKDATTTKVGSGSTITKLAAAQKVTGMATTVTNTATNKSIVVAGSTYTQAENVATNKNIIGFSVSALYDATLYLDENGYFMQAEPGVPAVTSKVVAVVRGYESLSNGVIIHMIEGKTADGTTVNWQTEDDHHTNAGDLFYYADSSSIVGAYKLTAADATTHDAPGTNYAWTVNTGNISKSSRVVTVSGTTYYFADDVKTIFVDDANHKVTVVNGVQDATASATVLITYALKQVGTNYVVGAIFVKDEASVTADTSKDLVYVYKFQSTTVREDASATNGYRNFYNYEAYIEGAKVDNFYTSTSASVTEGFYTISVNPATGAYDLGTTAYTSTSPLNTIEKGEVTACSPEMNIFTVGYTAADDSAATAHLSASGAMFKDLTNNGLESVENISYALTEGKYIAVSVVYGDNGAAQYVYVVQCTNSAKKVDAGSADAVKGLEDGVYELDTAPSDITDYGKGGDATTVRSFKFNLPGTTNKTVTLEIKDSDDNVVYSETVTNVTPGDHFFYVQVLKASDQIGIASRATGLLKDHVTAGSGDYKDGLTPGTYKWSIKAGSDVLISDTFVIS